MPITIISKDALTDADRKYEYEPELTKKLDSKKGAFDQSVIDEITLWKVGRYAHIDDRLLADLNSVSLTENPFPRSKVKEILVRLLASHGVGLRMASTYLRFRNPSQFQIIDQRAYRVLYGKEICLPGKETEANREELVEIYYRYLDKLRITSGELGIAFEKSDRILYTFDKRENKNEKLKSF